MGRVTNSLLFSFKSKDKKIKQRSLTSELKELFAKKNPIIRTGVNTSTIYGIDNIKLG